jgi:DNA uptake protein ComE-like DNA-binding protein
MTLKDNHTTIPKVQTNLSRGASFEHIEKEISQLEKDLREIDAGIRSLQSQIHNRYGNEIARIHELSGIHKSQRKQKQEKRKEQKKRGKNFREPAPSQNTTSHKKHSPSNPDSQLIKQLYREAMVQVHPDKFVNESDEKSKRSQDLTIQLIDIYQKGDLEQLKLFHRYILSGSAMASAHDTEFDSPAKQELLEKKRKDLLQAIAEAKQSRFYEVITTYTDPLTFIDELSGYFMQRIAQLEKRTRVRKKNGPESIF